ncbi:hypothetical protein D0Z00_002395 [Geotrichum galactomycetum]|uniref:Uncharacterized protein n=1 Tax=Geotrichum galactomycetum TaxID=27317 RepID=A0ACB6V4E5_9ASCO|nr:hypothetical protein D0Z00_002395 [Geotrichum candidum]
MISTILDNLKSSTYVLISDENIIKFSHIEFFEKKFLAEIESRKLEARFLKYIVPPGEASKNRTTKAQIEDYLLSKGCTRDTVIFAMGGGVIGDMIGYVAATFMRGVRFVQIPTSLLSMVDSSIGGKTAIDTPHGKNLIGAFWQPKFVFIDLKFLETLPEQVVSADEREGGLRNLLNFGHTIGHAYEAILAPHVLHGECVSIGMVLEAEIARHLGHLSDGAVARLSKCLSSFNLPVSPNDPVVRRRSKNISTPVDKLLDIMNVDKKNDGSKKKIAMLTRIGSCLEKQATLVSDEVIRTVLSENIVVGYFDNAPVHTDVTPPGSKSISNRALVLAAMGSGTVRITNLLHSDDTEYMLNAVQKLGGATVAWENHGETLVVKGNGGQLTAPVDPLYLGNAGTAARFLTTVATLVKPSKESSHIILTGNARMKQRPVGSLVEALRANGSEIEFQEAEGSLPLRVTAGQNLKGGRIELSATISSQYVSSILMCAPYAEEPVTLSLVGGKPISQLYIDMTIAMMATFGVKVEKSTTEKYTYHVPKGAYVNPAEYVIESDASSATYPLAFAALSGTSCTIPNIGSSSLQGDARFAVDVLRPMGCKVTQGPTSTTVQGPPIGSLKAIPNVDMEPMTDAFLTASVLAAIASGTTRIYGIANQRVKECNRIDAMIHELAKFGVVTREHSDGLEIDGTPIENLSIPDEFGIRSYDDHRVAMSMSLISSVVKQDVLIQERRCVEKTWPGWWDILSRVFNVGLKGHSDIGEVPKHVRIPNEDKTIIIIGMRGAGKTSMGKWVASSLGLKFVDMDDHLESKLNATIPQIIEKSGWEGFRAEELKDLQEFVIANPRGHVVSCGGGIVETPAARDLLKDWIAKGRLVLHVHRNISDIVSYLEIDKTRPAYTSDIYAVWKRREQWYNECSNHFYYSSFFQNSEESTRVKQSLNLFLRTITGVRSFEVPKGRTAFVCLPLPDLREFKDLEASLVGSSAVELRVDLLREKDQVGDIPSIEYVNEQVGYLRKATQLPIVFTVRTKSQGGNFPDDAEEEAEKLISLAYKLGIEVVDVELTWSNGFLSRVVAQKGYTKIFASHHNVAGELKWNNPVWEDYYQKALSIGDVVKFVGMAKSIEDNFALEAFRAGHTRKPLVAINMGFAGQLSRVLNKVLTPVNHETFPVKAAPGQLTVKEINSTLHLIGGLEKKEFFVAGNPVKHSRSPALHNASFEAVGLGHNYIPLETETVEEVFEHIKQLGSRFGGASVTIPYKLAVIPFLNETTEKAKLVGAVNTIIPTEDGRLVGDNTDWLGVVNSFIQNGANQVSGTSGHSSLVIGAGGTSRAAIAALHELGISTIYLLNRTTKNAEEVAAAFPAEYGVQVVSTDSVSEITQKPLLAVSCVPADKPLPEELLSAVTKFLDAPLKNAPYQPVLLDVAYKPFVTPVMELAQKSNYKTVGGRDMLVYQGVEQFQIWTDVPAPLEIAKKAVYAQDD